MTLLVSDLTMSLLADIVVFFARLLAIPTVVAWGVAALKAKTRHRRLAVGTGLAVFVLSFIICFATLSWTPNGTLNYSGIQVFISGLLMVILVVGAVLRLPKADANMLLIWWGSVVGYSLGWSIIAGSTDGSGLWAAGLVFLLAGLTVGIGVAIALAWGYQLLVRQRGRRHSAPQDRG